MKKSALVMVLLVALGAVLVLRSRKAEPPPTVAPAVVPPTASVPRELHPAAPAPLVAPDVPAAPAPALVSAPAELDVVPVWTPDNVPALEVQAVLNALGATVRNYGQRFRGNPVGNNAEITAALAGDNPQGVHFLEAERDRVNERGELVDAWGTPYFFHQLSGTEMEIHSAGPDRRLGTADDLQSR